MLKIRLEQPIMRDSNIAKSMYYLLQGLNIHKTKALRPQDFSDPWREQILHHLPFRFYHRIRSSCRSHCPLALFRFALDIMVSSKHKSHLSVLVFLPISVGFLSRSHDNLRIISRCLRNIFPYRSKSRSQNLHNHRRAFPVEYPSPQT
jgi:hypothetical protein